MKSSMPRSRTSFEGQTIQEKVTVSADWQPTAGGQGAGGPCGAWRPSTRRRAGAPGALHTSATFAGVGTTRLALGWRNGSEEILQTIEGLEPFEGVKTGETTVERWLNRFPLASGGRGPGARVTRAGIEQLNQPLLGLEHVGQCVAI